MDVYWLLNLYKTVRRIFLYSSKNLIQSPEELAEFINKKNPGTEVTPADILAALAYGTLCEDRSFFDIKIKYRSPKSINNPAATYTFNGKPVKSWHIKRIRQFEKRYGELRFKDEEPPNLTSESDTN